jgi:hypothetical protein
MTASATPTEAQPGIELHVGSRAVHHAHFDRRDDSPPMDDGGKIGSFQMARFRRRRFDQATVNHHLMMSPGTQSEGDRYGRGLAEWELVGRGRVIAWRSNWRKVPSADEG